jgi:hypothetical protein
MVVHGEPAELVGLKVLYILGSSRSGSTVLANILGEFDGFVSAGEVRFLWERVTQGRRCGCGRPVAECDLWASVLGTEGRDVRKSGALAKLQREALRVHREPRLLRQNPHKLLESSSLARYVEAVGDVYGRLAEITGARVIVDSSKRPTNGAVLRMVRGVEPYFLHLVRDPRAVAYSNIRGKRNPDSERYAEMPTATVRYSSLHWAVMNFAAEDVCRHYGRERSLYVRYEDFMALPKPTVDRILRLVGERASGTPFLDARTVSIGTHHTVSGNADRFTKGRILIAEDSEWKQRMNPRDRLTATVLTLPLLRRYGYRARSRVGAAVQSPD